jgi:hypothetical protein
MRQFGSGAVLVLACLVAGCGRATPPTMDLGEARTALSAALDAWKDGRASEPLRDRRPPVDFRDVEWDRGASLARYEIEKGEPSGLSARFTVKLYLTDKAGANRTRAVCYNVDAGPTIVIRPDF